MNFKKFIILSGFAIAMIATAQIALAEEAVFVPVDSAIAESSAQPGAQNDMQWAWGEVTNLDSQAKMLTLKYLDYETDQEKDLVLIVDENTTFENVKDLNELKLKDTLSIDYMIGADNRNIAKNISFEKPDTSPSAPVLITENNQPVVAVAADKPAVETAQPAVSSVEPAAAVLTQPKTPVVSSAATTTDEATAPPVASETVPPATQVQPQ
ncbi:MAG: hypothetical protein PHS66_03280 [Candidatus Omnitrophica bacterium]|nr:hypothetical protein [Candidatus Omnitrophota bacterium]